MKKCAKGQDVSVRRNSAVLMRPAVRRLGFAAMILLFGARVPCPAQTPQKIVDEYVHAAGGVKALTRIQTRTIAGSVRVESKDLPDDDADRAGSYSLIVKAANQYYSETLIAGSRAVTAYNGKSGWEQNGSAAPRTLTGAEESAAEATARYLNGGMLNLKRNKIGARLIGTQDVNGHPAYHLELSFAPGVTRDVFFDAATHLIVREQVPASSGTAAEQIDYFDYLNSSGIEEPRRIEIRRADTVYRISVARVELNSPVNDSTFNFPRADKRPLPDIGQLLRDMNRNQKAIEEIQKLYTCHLNVEEEKVDSNGQTTRRETKDYDVYYVGENEVRRLLAKDGKPLDGDEKKKEEDRFSKEFDELKKKQAELANDPQKQAKQEEQEDEQISDFLRAEQFTNPRREIFRGHEVIVFDFGPNPDYKPRRLAEKIVQKLGGVVWVDEQARDVARLEARFNDTAKIGGGIVGSLSKGSNLVFEQARINEEVWLPSYAEVHASARIAFVKFKQNEIDRYSDYRKFSSEARLGVSAPIPDVAAPAASPTISPETSTPQKPQ
jgi:hypothetical protein